jgi:hypothetical protein
MNRTFIWNMLTAGDIFHAYINYHDAVRPP